MQRDECLVWAGNGATAWERHADQFYSALESDVGLS